MLVVKNPSASAGDSEMRVRFLAWEDPLEEGMATHSSSLAWRIPRIEESGGDTVHRAAKSETRLKQLTRTYTGGSSSQPRLLSVLPGGSQSRSQLWCVPAFQGWFAGTG